MFDWSIFKNDIDKMFFAAMFTIPMLLFWFSDGPVDENLAEVCKMFAL